VDLLNQAIANISMAQSIANSNPTEAQTLANQAASMAAQVQLDLTQAKQEGQAQQQTALAELAIFVVALLAAAELMYRFGPDALWSLWLRTRKDYSVQAKPATEENNKKKAKPGKNAKGGDEDEEAEDDNEEPLLTMDNISKIIAVLLVVIAIVAVTGVALANRPGEQFSELGILGPTQNLSNYPTTVVAGSTINLYVYVGNQLGSPAWYSVLVKVGDNSTLVNPALVSPALSFDDLLLPGANSTIPVSITLNNVGTDQRIIFELWQFNSTAGAFQYTQLWDQIWLNVTASPI
jgi:hypothetical protein